MRLKYAPDHFVCNSAHLIGKAVLVSTVSSCCDGDGTGVLTNMLSENLAVGIGELVRQRSLGNEHQVV